MNVTELARQLKVNTSELLERVPGLGFDIGKKAIKVDDRIAFQIIDAWRRKDKKEKEMRRLSEIRSGGQNDEESADLSTATEIKIPATITVREFAALANLPVNRVLAELMKNGVLISMNERIDFDTASIISDGLGLKVVVNEDIAEEDDSVKAQERLKEIIKNKDGNVFERPPVIVVMGHVDHGKTKILDAIRKTDVVSGESGGITQHIGAYQIKKNDRLITFIDTPGHEAFTAMRSRGARVADLAILVIAADDGIQPQTKEAIKIIQDAKLPFVVAINKVDKPEANIDKVKQELAQINLLPEDWGGQVVCVSVSAKEGQGIDDLLETLLLLADLDKENFLANQERLAIGTIIESHVDKGEGPVATILVQAGTLRVGDHLAMGNFLFGKVRALRDYKGENITQALPGMPAKILGLKSVPGVGSILEAASDIKNLDKDVRRQKASQERDFSTVAVKDDEDNAKLKFINLIVKSDVLGSAEAIIESLVKLDTDKVKIKIIGKGLGIITEADVLKAEATGAKIIGFHIKAQPSVAELARTKKVEIKFYTVIYHLIEDIKKEIDSLKEDKAVKKLIGKLEVLKVFRREAKNMILGGRVIDGGLAVSDTVIVVRDGKPLSSGKVNRLECAKAVVNKVGSGQECGINFEGDTIIEAGDVLEFYQEG